MGQTEGAEGEKGTGKRTTWVKDEEGEAGSGPMCLSRFYKSIKRGISDWVKYCRRLSLNFKHAHAFVVPMYMYNSEAHVLAPFGLPPGTVPPRLLFMRSSTVTVWGLFNICMISGELEGRELEWYCFYFMRIEDFLAHLSMEISRDKKGIPRLQLLTKVFAHLVRIYDIWYTHTIYFTHLSDTKFRITHHNLY